MLLDSIDFLQKNNRNTANLKILRQSLETGNLSHAYLFCGSSIEDLSKLALFFASSANCKQNGCGTCDICANTLKEIYSNLLIIEADGIILTKEKVVELQKFASMSAHTIGKKICIVKEVELMNKEASNRFLKTLEDPPDANTIFILLSEDLSGILPTIVSRCSVFEWDFIYERGNNWKIGNSLIFNKLDEGIRKILKQCSKSTNLKNSEISIGNNSVNNSNPFAHFCQPHSQAQGYETFTRASLAAANRPHLWHNRKFRLFHRHHIAAGHSIFFHLCRHSSLTIGRDLTEYPTNSR